MGEHSSGSLFVVPSATLVGAEGRPVRVEVYLAYGLPSFTVVGQPETTCRAVRDRIRAALLASGLSWPSAKRVTVNVAPSGGRLAAGLDLPIAVGLLAADGQLDAGQVGDRAFVGELELDGRIRSVAGVVCLVEALAASETVVPVASVAEAQLAGRSTIRATDDLGRLVDALREQIPWPGLTPTPPAGREPAVPDFGELCGPPAATFALEVAAAGGHPLLFVASSGSSTAILARQLVGLLPNLTAQQALEVSRVRSAAGLPIAQSGRCRPPFRGPHHSVPAVALLGGGTSALRPGELSLAHRGVLFLDDLDMFGPAVLDSLRQPLDEGVIRLARATTTAALPASFLLVAATKPCPYGEGDTTACRCTPQARSRYIRRLSTPTLDRFDLRIRLAAAPEGVTAEPIEMVAARVAAARELAQARRVNSNSELTPERLVAKAPLDAGATWLVERAVRHGRLSGRGLGSVRRVALTIADLAGDQPPLGADHVEAALALRSDLTHGAAADRLDS